MIRYVLPALFALVFAGACSDDCESLCKEAQERDCTSISSECGSFCENLQSISEKGSCASSFDAYQSCLSDDDVCTGDARCGSQRDTLGACAASYCLANSSSTECAAISADI